MLFDFGTGRRKRFIQVLYASLAILMGGGLVLFGIGGEVSGGLLDAFRDESSKSAATEQFQKRLDEQEKKLAANPEDTKALAQVAKLHAQVARAGENFNSDQGRFTAKGLVELGKADAAWKRYLKADPKVIDRGLSVIMASQVYGSPGLEKPDEAVKAWEKRLDSGNPTSGLFAQYAQLAYLANQNQKGDQAAARAVELAPKADRKELKEGLASLKAQVLQQTIQQGSQSQDLKLTP